jgi:hypothetical protein
MRYACLGISFYVMFGTAEELNAMTNIDEMLSTEVFL